MVLRLLIAALALGGCDAVTVVEGDGAEGALDALRRAGVSAEARGRAVVVPGAEVARAVEALRAHDVAAPQPDRPLLATETEVRGRREATLGARAAAMLRELQGVRAARVTVALPPPAAFDATVAEAPRAMVALTVNDAAFDPSRARATVAATVTGMRPDDVRVALRVEPGAPPPRFEWVGPWAVAPSSARSLRAAMRLSPTLLAVGLLAGAATRRVRRG